MKYNKSLVLWACDVDGDYDCHDSKTIWDHAEDSRQLYGSLQNFETYKAYIMRNNKKHHYVSASSIGELYTKTFLSMKEDEDEVVLITAQLHYQYNYIWK